MTSKIMRWMILPAVYWLPSTWSQWRFLCSTTAADFLALSKPPT